MSQVKSMALGRIKKLLPELGKHTEIARQAETEIAERIASLQRERAALLTQPITRDDYADLICADIDRLANDYKAAAARKLRDRMKPGERNGDPANVATALAFGDRTTLSCFGGLRSLQGAWDFGNDPLMQGAATFLFRDSMKRAAVELVAALEPWPFPDAIPMADAVARINAIDGELELLGVEKAEIADLLQAVGVQSQ